MLMNHKVQVLNIQYARFEVRTLVFLKIQIIQVDMNLLSVS